MPNLSTLYNTLPTNLSTTLPINLVNCVNVNIDEYNRILYTLMYAENNAENNAENDAENNVINDKVKCNCELCSGYSDDSDDDTVK